MHDRSEDVLAPDEPSIEQRQPRHRHGQDKRGGSEHPGCIPCIDLENWGCDGGNCLGRYRRHVLGHRD